MANDEGSNGGKWYMKIDISLTDNYMNMMNNDLWLHQQTHALLNENDGLINYKWKELAGIKYI